MKQSKLEDFSERQRQAIDWCNRQTINWKLIDTITLNLDLLSDEGKRELEYALDLLSTCEYWGLSKKAAYIRRRIREKMNYIEGR